MAILESRIKRLEDDIASNQETIREIKDLVQGLSNSKDIKNLLNDIPLQDSAKNFFNKYDRYEDLRMLIKWRGMGLKLGHDINRLWTTLYGQKFISSLLQMTFDRPCWLLFTFKLCYDGSLCLF